MKKGIPCNDLWMIGLAGQDKIIYTFVTEDGNTPSSCTVSLGDMDPVTGKSIADLEFFREYNRMRNREVYYNNKGIRVPFSKKEEAARREEWKRIEEEFRQEYGYTPSPETVSYLLEQKWPARYHQSMDACMDGKDVPEIDRRKEYADPQAEEEFRDVENEQLSLLRDFASKLEGRLKDVYELMLREANQCFDGPSGEELGRKWGVSRQMIHKDRKKLEFMIRGLLKDGHTPSEK